MPTSLDTIQRIIVKAEEHGLSELSAKYKQVTTEAELAAVAIESGGKAAERADRGLETFRKAADPLHRDLRGLEVDARRIQSAFGQGLFGGGEEGISRYNAAMQQALERTKSFQAQQAAQKRAAEEAAAAAEREAAAIDSVTKSLDAQIARLHMSEAEHERFAALQRAGTTAATPQGQAIVARVDTARTMRDQQALAAQAREILQQINPQVEAQKRLEAQLKRNQAIFNSGLFGKGEEGMKNFAKANALAEDQVRKVTKGVGLSASAIQNLSFQLNDVVSGLAMGQSPFTVLTQQGGQVYQALQGPSGVVAGLKEAGKWLVSLITPARALGLGLAGAAFLAVKAWNDWDNSQKEVVRTITGLGRSLGLTKDQFNDLAAAAAKAGDVSVSSARDMLNTLGRTGQIVNPQDLARAVGLAKDYAATFTNGDIDAAMKEQADLIRSGASGIQSEMRARGLISDTNRQALEHAVNLNKTAEAYGIFLDSLNGRLVKHAEVTGNIATAWDKVKTAFKDMMDAAGPFLDKAAQFLEASLRGAANVLKGDFSHNPVTQATPNTAAAILSGTGASLGGQDIGPTESQRAGARVLKETADASNEAAKATDNLKTALEAKAVAMRASTENDKAAIPPIKDTEKAEADLQLKLNDRASALSKTLSAFKPGDNVEEMKKVQSQWILVTDAIKGNDDAQKRKALSDSEVSNGQQDVKKALEERTAAEVRQQTISNTEIQTARDIADAVNGQSKEFRELTDKRKAMLALPVEKRDADYTETLEKLNHQLDSQTDKTGRRITDEEKSADAIRTSEKAITDRTVTQRVATAVEQKRQELVGRGVTGAQAENEAQAAGNRVRLEAIDAIKRQSEEMDRELKTVQLEKDLTFASNQERQAALAARAKEVELIRANGEATDATSQAAIRQAAALAKAKAELQDYQQLWGGVRDAGASAMTSLVQDLAKGTKAGDAFKKAIGSLGDQLLGIAGKNIFGGISSGISTLASGGGTQAAMTALSSGLSTGNLAVAGIGFALSYFGNRQAEAKAKKQKAAQDEIDRLQKEQEAAMAKQADELQKQVDLQNRINDYQERLATAQLHGNDSLGARLQLFDISAQRDRASEAEKGNGAIVQLEAALAQERINIIDDFNKEVLARSQSFQDRLFAATNDTESLTGQLIAFDRDAQKQRAEEWRQGNGAVVDLESALAAERLKIIQDYNKQAIADQKAAADELKKFWSDLRKTIQKFIDDLQGGKESPLSPLNRLAAAQGAFQSQFSLARTGNRDALEGITGYASTLLDAARDAYASGQQFQDIYRYVLQSLQAIQAMGLGGKAAVVTPTAPAGPTPVGTAANTNIPPVATPAAAGAPDLLSEIRSLRTEVAAFRIENREGVARDTNVVHSDLETLTGEVRSAGVRQQRETRVAALRPRTGTNG